MPLPTGTQEKWARTLGTCVCLAHSRNMIALGSKKRKVAGCQERVGSAVKIKRYRGPEFSPRHLHEVVHGCLSPAAGLLASMSTSL